MPMPLPVAVLANRAADQLEFTRNIDSQNVFNRISQAAEMTARRMCMWAAPEYNEKGEHDYTRWWIKAQIALSLAYTVLNTAILNHREDIANRYWKISKQKKARFFGKFAPLEKQLLGELKHTSDRWPGHPVDYDGARKYTSQLSNNAKSLYNDTIDKLYKQYSICADPSLDADQYTAGLNTDLLNNAYRSEETYSNQLWMDYWNRRLEMLNFGNDNETNGYKAAGAADSAFNDVAKTLNDIGGGMMNFFGYMNNRVDTVYPTMYAMTAPLQSMGGFVTAGTQGFSNATSM